jgi:hypothetical protein
MAKKLSPPEVMRNLAIGYWVARLVHVAAKLRLADLLRQCRTVSQPQGAVLSRRVPLCASHAGGLPRPIHRQRDRVMVSKTIAAPE